LDSKIPNLKVNRKKGIFWKNPFFSIDTLLSLGENIRNGLKKPLHIDIHSTAFKNTYSKGNSKRAI
jgi:hypothetical protein